MGYVEVGARCLIAVVFAVAVVGKLRGRAEFGEFAESLRAMRLLPGRLVVPAATAVVAAEVLTVVLVAVPGSWHPAGLVLGAGLLVAFAAGIALARRRGSRARCRCFGSSGAELSVRHAVRNLLVAGAAVVGVLAGAGGGVSLHAAGVVVALVIGALLALIVVVADDLFVVFQPARRPAGRP